MKEDLEIGLRAVVSTVVSEKNTAVALGSGGVQVFATPSMIALMEQAAMVAAQKALGEDQGTVGTHLDVKHTAATPLAMEVRAEAELIAIEGKRLVFKVVAFDEVEQIGEGTHERYIINVQRFMDKVVAKGK